MTKLMDTKKGFTRACEFDRKSQNCSGFWKVSSMGQVPEQECTVTSISPGTPSGQRKQVPYCPDAMMEEVFKPQNRLPGCFSIAAIKMNKPNQHNILYGDGCRASPKIRSVAFKYKLLCAM